VVDRLANELKTQGVTVWLDRNNIEPGARWQIAIKNAIRSGKFFIACYSQEAKEREKAYMWEEITLAIDELRLRPTDRKWFIPVLINNTTIPSRRISAVEDLSDINALKLYEDWNNGINRILRELEHDNPEMARVWNLIEIVEKPFAHERLHAIRQLGAMGILAKRAVPTLIETTQENNAEIKKSSVVALGEIGPAAAAAVPSLTAALNDLDENIRWNAADALGKMGPSAAAAVPSLVAAMNDLNRGVQWSAAGALGKIGPAAVASLIAALSDSREGVRRRAVDALGEIGPTAVDAVPALVAALNDSDEDVRRRAADALNEVRPGDDDAEQSSAPLSTTPAKVSDGGQLSR